MQIQLSLEQRIKQELKLAQIVSLSKLISVPDEVLNVVVGAISYNPDSVESLLKNQKGENTPDNYSDNKVQSIYSSLTPSKGDSGSIKKGGLIIYPDLRILEKSPGNYQTRVTPDVTYIGRKDDKPEIVFSDHIKGSISLTLEVDPSIYPETSKLLSQLKKFDEWKRSTLRKTYVILGDEQREFLEELDTSRFNLFNQERLANELNLSQSTVSRVLCNRWVEARNVRGEQKFLYAKDLCVTQDDINRYTILPRLNQIFMEEFKRKKAFSDWEISRRVPNIARRTINKYRSRAGIPNTSKRNDLYKSSCIEEPYVIF